MIIFLYLGGIFGMITASKVSTSFFSTFYISSIKARSINFFLQKLIWLSTLIPLIGLVYTIYTFEGLTNQLAASKEGGEVLSGYGFWLLLQSFIYPINIFYAALIFKNNLLSKNKLSFFFHIILVFVIAILSLSRGSLLVHILFIIMLYHYLVRKFFIYQLILFAIVLLGAASIYEAARVAIYFKENSDISFNFKEEIISIQWTFGGLFPVSKILSSAIFHEPLSLGSTYIAGITRFLPLNFFPNKLAGGGELFTENYASNIYNYGHHFSGGLLAEAIINFGFIGGIIFSYVQLFVIGLVLIINYKKVMYALKKKNGEFILIFYLYCLWTFTLLIYGEFATFFYHFSIKVLVTIILFRIYNFKIRTMKVRYK
jgi:oligosaccharide repeat unit polymerase